MRAVHSLVLCLVACSLASGQGCPIGDDGFNAGWCQPVTAVNLPAFPTITQTAAYCCIKDCAPEQQFSMNVTITPSPILCDYYFFFISATPTTLLGPTITAPFYPGKYARTWTEPPTTPIGFQRQVWRFMLNGDATITAASLAGTTSSPCPVPPCNVPPALGGPGLPVHLAGHVDLACELDPTAPNQLLWSAALNLNHWCGHVSHVGWGARPLPVGSSARHEDRSYHLVSPGTFVCNTHPAPQGQIIAESIRTGTFSIPPYTCLGELPVVGTQLQTFYQDCPCGTNPFGIAGGYEHQLLTGFGDCGPLIPPAPFGSIDLLAHPFGAWTGPPGSFPGTRDLTTYWGFMQYADPCDPTSIPIHVVTGVTTGNHLGVTFGSGTGPVGGGPVTSNAFMDLQNCLAVNAIFPGIGPYWGSLFFSQIVWNLNVP